MAFAREKQEQYLSQTVVIQCYFSSKWCCHGWSLETLTQKPGEEFDLQDFINFKRKALVVAPNHITPDRSRAAFLLHSKWFCLRAHSYPECLGPRSMLLLLLLLLLFHQCPVELPFAWWQSRIFMDLATCDQTKQILRSHNGHIQSGAGFRYVMKKNTPWAYA